MQLIKVTAARLLTLSLITVSLFAFSTRFGADSFEVYLNKKLILQDYVHSTATSVKSFTIDASQPDAQVDIYYNHCGKLGKSRNIVLKDAKNNVIRSLKFSDGNKFMSFKVKDIMSTDKNQSVAQLNLYYTADLLPEARMLASIVVKNDSRAVAGK